MSTPNKITIVDDDRMRVSATMEKDGRLALFTQEKTGRDAYVNNGVFFTKEQAQKLGAFIAEKIREVEDK